MAFKQPRVPEYRESEGTGKYLRSLVLFLKDFCMDVWTANNQRTGEIDAVKGGLSGIHYPVTSVCGKTGDVALTAEDVGALSVNGTAENAGKLGGKTAAELMLTLYPVGAVYISANSTSPASLFGGTWEILNDVFLLAAGSYANAGTFGGEAAHALTVNEMPVHHHSLGHTGNHSSFSVTWGNIYANVEIPSAIAFTHTPGEALAGNSLVVFQNEDSATATSGGGAAHNNLPPYMAVYMWKRVS